MNAIATRCMLTDQKKIELLAQAARRENLEHNILGDRNQLQNATYIQGRKIQRMDDWIPGDLRLGALEEENPVLYRVSF